MSKTKTDLAREVTLNPHKYYRLPAVLKGNWAQLKAAQGHPITPDRMARLHPNYGITRNNADTGPSHDPSPIAADLAERAPRISRFVSNHLRKMAGA